MQKVWVCLCALLLLFAAGGSYAAPVVRLYVEPGHISLRPDMQQKFKVYGLDMFDNEVPVTEPLTWSTQTNAGSITSDGQFTAGTAAGTYMQGVKVTTPSGLTGIAPVTISSLPAQGGYVWEKSWGDYIPGELLRSGRISAGPNGTILVNQSEHAIQQYDRDGRYINQIGPLYVNAASDWYIFDIASDGEFVYAGYRDEVVKYGADGKVVSVMTSGVAGSLFGKNGAMACDKDKNLYVADGNIKIQKISSAGKLIKTFGSQGTGDGQFGGESLSLCCDPSGNLYVGDHANNRIQKFDGNGNFLAKWTSYGPDNTPIDGPTSVASDPNGNLYINVGYVDFILKLSASEGTITKIPTPREIAYNPCYLDSDRNFYACKKLSQTDEPSIIKYSPSGVLLAEWGKPHRGGIVYPSSIAVSPDGSTIYLGDQLMWDVRKLDSNGSRLARWQQNSSVNTVRLDKQGNLYSCDVFGVKKYSPEGTALKEYNLPPASIGIPWAQGVGIAPNGDIYTSGPDHIYRFNSDGQLIAQLCTKGPGSGQIDGINSLAIDNHNNIYISEVINDRMQKLDSNGNYIAQWTGSMRIPGGISLGPDGSLFVAEIGNDSIHRFSQTGLPLAVWGSVGRETGQFYYLVDVALDSKGKAYTVEQSNKRVNIFTPIVDATSRAKELKDGEFVALSNQVVTATANDLGDCMYIESADRSCGLRVTGVTSGRGYHVTVMGAMTTVNGERTLKASSISAASFAPISPIGITNKALGGGDANYDPLFGAGQRGVEDGAGANNIGLLVTTTGKVTGVGSDFFYIDDGTHARDGSVFVGVRVQCRKLAKPKLGDNVTVTGISRISKIGDRCFRSISARLQGDIVVAQ